MSTPAPPSKVRTPGEIYGLMEKGGQLRATGATRMNDTSSRSHAVFIIIVEQARRSHIYALLIQSCPRELGDLLSGKTHTSGDQAIMVFVPGSTLAKIEFP